MSFPEKGAFHAYRPSAWLQVTGADAAAFLQGQFTNDIRPVQAGSAVYGLWLNQKGKVMADSFIRQADAPDGFWIGSIYSPASTIRGRLESHIIADDVAVEDVTGAWCGAALVGLGSGDWLASKERSGVIFRGRRSSLESWEWIFPQAEAGRVRAELSGIREMGPAEIERSRILAGIPAVPADIGPGDLPNEGGLDGDAISYVKGCYLGQEVMARLKSKGRIRRRLRIVAGSGPPPAVPAALWLGGAKAGELRSAAADGTGSAFVGLAMLSLANLRTEEPLSLSGDGKTAARISIFS